MVEVRGYLGAVAVADAALKAANVHLAASERIKGGITTIVLNGDVAAVAAAVEAAIVVGKQIGTYRSHHVIPRPDRQTDLLFAKEKLNRESEVISARKEEVKIRELLSSQKVSELEDMKVVDLRKLALTFENFTLSSKEIKYATKAVLIEAIKETIIKQGGK